MVVLLILGVVASLAMPSTEQMRPAQAEAAVGSVVQALRFAQDDAISSNSYRMVRCDVANNRITVSTLNLNTSPPVANTATPVLHPIDRRPYFINLSTMAPTSGVSLASCAFTYYVGAIPVTLGQVQFDPSGAPVYISAVDDGELIVRTLASNGTVIIGSASHRRSISVATSTGRVTAPLP